MASEYSSQSRRRNRLLAALTPADNSERRIAVVITTGYRVDRGKPDLGEAVAILQKPHSDSDLINAIQKATVAAFPPMIGFGRLRGLALNYKRALGNCLAHIASSRIEKRQKALLLCRPCLYSRFKRRVHAIVVHLTFQCDSSRAGPSANTRN